MSEQIKLPDLLNCPFCSGNVDEELTVTEFSIRCAKCKANIVGDADDELLTCLKWNARAEAERCFIADAEKNYDYAKREGWLGGPPIVTIAD